MRVCVCWAGGGGVQEGRMFVCVIMYACMYAYVLARVVCSEYCVRGCVCVCVCVSESCAGARGCVCVVNLVRRLPAVSH